jgi:osmotically-inducible protein OsmY
MDMVSRIGVYRFFIVTAILIAISGCMDAAMTGAQVVYNRNDLQKKFADQYITLHAYRAIYVDTDRFKDSHVSISTFHGVVLLAGQVPTTACKNAINKIIRTIAKNNQIYNLTIVSSPPSSLTRMSDSWITAKIKAKLIAMDDIDPSQIKVVTENGTVFLMGQLFPSQAQIAVDVASNTDGVQNVVKVFSYLRISRT